MLKGRNVHDLARDYQDALAHADQLPPEMARKLRDFERFVRRESHHLARWPELLFPLAVAQPKDSFVAVQIQDGTVTNTNTTVAGSIINYGAVTIVPGATLSVTGDYTQISGGLLDVQLGGTPASGQFGKLIVTGTATLAGTLQVDLVNGYGGNPGAVFTILTFGSRMGDFDNLILPLGAVWDPNAGTVSF